MYLRSRKRSRIEEPEARETRRVQRPMVVNYHLERLDLPTLMTIISLLDIDDRLNFEKVCGKLKNASELCWRGIKKLVVSNTAPEKINKKKIEMQAGQSKLGKIMRRVKALNSCVMKGRDNWTGYLTLITSNCQSITALTISVLVLSNRHDYKAKFRCLKHLKSLDLYVMRDERHEQLFLPSVVAILQGLPAFMEKIFLQYAYDDELFELNGTEEWIEIFNRWTVLKFLTLSRWSLDRRFLEILSSRISLEILDLSSSRFEESNPPVLPNLINLKSLKIKPSDATVPNWNDLVSGIANNCQQLEQLVMPDLEGIVMNVTLQQLGQLQSLKRLVLPRSEVDASVVDELGNLTHLDCSYCNNVDDRCVIQFVNRSPDLEFISLVQTGITHESIQHLQRTATERRKKITVAAARRFTKDFGNTNFFKIKNNRN